MANYLIVGGSKGIGEALSKSLANNHHVTVVARNSNTNLPASVQQMQLDVTTEIFNYEHAVLDGLVYCPGTINLKPFARISETEFLEDFQINLVGAIKIIQANLPKLKQSNRGSIVLFSTVAVAQGMPFHSSVAASKGAIEGFAKSLAAELAPQIRVNVIAPSITNTPLAAKLLSSDDKIQKSGERHPLKRVGAAEDIAQMAEFLLSDKASWITGQVMAVDGGMSTLRTF